MKRKRQYRIRAGDFQMRCCLRIVRPSGRVRKFKCCGGQWWRLSWKLAAWPVLSPLAVR